MEKILYILTGQTAVGKTELSLEWAEANNAEILSCDSLLFYKGIDIGTAKPNKYELSRVRHYGIDVADVTKQFSVKDYIDLARDVVNDVFGRGKNLLITGGSGFYLKSFMAPVIDNIEVPDNIKEHVKDLEEEKGLPALIAELEKFNKGRPVEGIDLQNPRRVIKALQRCIATGRGIGELQKEFEDAKGAFDEYQTKICLLERDKTVLKQRVNLRVKAMLELGLIDEVKQLRDQGIEENESASKAIGYKETLNWLDQGSSDINELGIEIAKNTMCLVAKQRKWFKYQLTADTEINLDRKVELSDLFPL